MKLTIVITAGENGWWNYDVQRTGDGRPNMRATGARRSLALAVSTAVDQAEFMAKEETAP